MKNSEKSVTVAAVGNMSLGQQMSHARRNGHDSFISTDGRLYIRKGGKWKLMPQPKLSPAEEAMVRGHLRTSGIYDESTIQQMLATIALTKVGLS